jgi:hypothetical protein
MMAISMPTLPEAEAHFQQAMMAAADVLSVLSSITERRDPLGDGDLELVEQLLQASDSLLEAVAETAKIGRLPDQVAGLSLAAQTIRQLTYYVIATHAPDLAWYWTPENQARIRAEDAILTPELRADVLADAAADYAALERDPVALAQARAEEALWETTVGDGLDNT